MDSVALTDIGPIFDKRRQRGLAAAWASVLIVFSGSGHERDLAAMLRRAGIRVEVIDTKDGGRAHDVLANGLGDHLVRRVERGDFDAVFIATPCSSYSVRHRPQLRSRRMPLGITHVPAEWRRYLDKHNALATFTAELITAAEKAGVPWCLENPADRGDRASDAYWPKYADHAPIFRSPRVQAAITVAKGRVRTFAQCYFLSAFQKYTSIGHAECLDEWMAALDEMTCEHGTLAHEQQAKGRRDDGSSLSEESAAYPEQMNAFIACSLVECIRTIRQGRRQSDGFAPVGNGGRVADGAALWSEVAAACESARHTPPRFASMRHRTATDPSILRHAPFPGDLSSPPVPSRPKPSAGAAAVPLTTDPATAHSAAREERMARGPIRIEDLFLPGVYVEHIQRWLELAGRAAACLRRGTPAPHVPTERYGQERLQPFARGVVWDTRDPANCVPVVRSDRHTTFSGRRQIDRAALRRVAAAINWPDPDIIGQAGEGGVETRSTCPLVIILSFHHRGLLDNVQAAATAIQADIGEGWVAPPLPHLPFVPCRVLPRNVIVQDRTRLVKGVVGAAPSLEHYLKPRITTDESDGGDDAVNAGVPVDERHLVLPTAQQHARSLAICDTAGGSDTRAASYVTPCDSTFSPFTSHLISSTHPPPISSSCILLHPTPSHPAASHIHAGGGRGVSVQVLPRPGGGPLVSVLHLVR